jgi:heme/copper-type cytochrome/quinol oxidase subunit 2
LVLLFFFVVVLVIIIIILVSGFRNDDDDDDDDNDFERSSIFQPLSLSLAVVVVVNNLLFCRGAEL